MGTLAAILARVREKAQDSDDIRWPAPIKRAAVNECIRDLCSFTEIVTEQVLFENYADARYVPYNGAQVIRLLSDPMSPTVGHRLVAATEEALFEWNPDWQARTGTPEYFVYPYEQFAGVKRMLISPTPLAVLTDLVVRASILPADFTTDGIDDSEYLVTPPEYDDAISAGAAAILLRDSGPVEDLQRGSNFWDAYLQKRDQALIFKQVSFSNRGGIAPYRNF